MRCSGNTRISQATGHALADSNSPQTTRRPLSGKNVKDEDVASLRECFDEWVMCPPDFNTDRFSDAAEHLFRWNDAAGDTK